MTDYTVLVVLNFFICLLKTHSQAWWHTSVILALGKLRQEDHQFKANQKDKKINGNMLA
jgi:hypothetical protein